MPSLSPKIAAAGSLLDILFANRCVLCDRLGSSCCVDCRRSLALRLRRVERFALDGRAISGFALVDFDQSVSRLIHAFKEQSRTTLASVFAAEMAEAVSTLGQLALGDSQVALVAVPSRMSSVQQRGFSPGAVIAAAVQRRLGSKYRNRSSLVWRNRESADQASLGQSERNGNLQGAVTAATAAGAAKVVLIDDIVTTGSSLLETARALESAGAEILGFVTFSETILRNIGKTLT